VARSFSEFFREPDAQLGFLWGGATMGQLLSIPLFLVGAGFIIYALKHPLEHKAP
jgi:phosphatidylglycerol:prolipoprotein diacylglycerol transferase